MGCFYNEHYYKVNIQQLDPGKAMEFTTGAVSDIKSKNNTYNTYHYKLDRRQKNVFMGKLSEQAVAVFLKEQFQYDFQVNYDIYEGEHNVDEYDLIEKGFTFDVKSSICNSKIGIDGCIRSYNFPVPKVREPRDIVISLLVDDKLENWYIIAWIDKETYVENATDGYWEDEDMHWYKYPWRKGYHIKDLKIFFDNTNHFLNFIKNKK